MLSFKFFIKLKKLDSLIFRHGYNRVTFGPLGWMGLQNQQFAQGTTSATSIHPLPGPPLSFQPHGRLIGSCSICTQACKTLKAKAWQKGLSVQPWPFRKDLEVTKVHAHSYKWAGLAP